MEYVNFPGFLTIAAFVLFVGGLAILIPCKKWYWETIGSIIVLAGGICLGVMMGNSKLSAYLQDVRPTVPNVSQVIISPDGKSVDFPEPTLMGADWVIVHSKSVDQKHGEFVRNHRYVFETPLENVEVYLQFRDDTTSERVRVHSFTPAPAAVARRPAAPAASSSPPLSVPAGVSTTRPAGVPTSRPVS